MAVEGKITVSILSSNRLLRESIARILHKKKDIEVIGAECADFSSANKISLSLPAIWVSDSLDSFINQIRPLFGRKNEAGGKCVLMAMADDAKQFLKAVSHGVLGYVLEEGSADDVVSAVRGVALGQAVCPAHLTRVLFDYVSSQMNNPYSSRARKQFKLTRREQQLIPLVSRGLTNKEIAAELNLSEQTVKSHIHRMICKIGVENRFGIGAACEISQLDA
jgi:DNA-binding NarL/FixJ family response regulator